MKTLIAALISLTGLQAFAYPDQLHTVYACTNKDFRTDSTIQVELMVGGIAGVPQLRVTESFMGIKTVSTHFVHSLRTLPGAKSAEFRSNDGKVTFSVDYKKDLESGKYPAVVSVETNSEELLCTRPNPKSVLF